MVLLRWLLSIALWLSLASAWPWPPSFRDILGPIIEERQDTNSTSPSASQTVASPTASNTDAASTETDSDGSTTAASESQITTSAPNAATTSINQELPAGGIQMLDPSTGLSMTTYYKVGEQVSLAWNYTSIIASPSAVDVIVSCTANSATYTLASNMTVNSTGSVVWDTAPDASGTNPLLTETCTLVIFDAAGGSTAIPQAGKLAPYQFRFGMYVPQQYTPLSDYVCATCSGAMSDMERQTLKFLVGMAFITVASFTWFAGGFLAYF